MSGREHAPGEADLAWCHEAVQGVSRTFALTVDVLEEPMASQICVGYLLCRVADTVEDAGHIPPDAQSDVLRTYRRAIDPDDETDIGQFREAVDEWLPAERDDDWTVVAEAPTIAATFEELDPEAQAAIVPPVLEMVDGMAMFVDRHATEGGLRIDDREELEQYCYYAAGTVGNLITNLLTREDIGEERAERLRETAEEFGLLLQLVNVSKDVYDDYTEENNVYLPAEWLEAEGVDQERVVHPENRESSARVVDRTADYARSFLDDAQAYLETMPLSNGNTMEAWTVPYLLAVGTLRELGSRPEDALTETGVKVSRQEVFAVMSAASDVGRDSLAELRQTIARTPFHRAVGSAD
ncbi:Squalene/phytoene synthase [Halorubrum distributum JCM 9100]|uniref:Squalene/phytoene synthase n=6 Tax=Halorubrum TaxID=56688 RepID=M0EUX5_9EURY|nr:MULTISPECIES: phytoene/squalene synthase family protein [Halorubrum distributum group]ELZ50702.1 Squalene/phytoene synthase [Halorubrum distributum JCM 9100]ELZ52873.1 Squalene/phytoene synthase [Halorubrum distributum JCM 10118]EMA63169.1 Squalene/phytoene synthase [Halorubrum litoreum JCM 13561]EMA71936.1 Squalene/phytoene synthase [Halorubrum arcis JCM 13916]MYL15137.1 farnesyl-diphosphate farnesyltransferase [Halorubrum terrestre]